MTRLKLRTTGLWREYWQMSLAVIAADIFFLLLFGSRMSFPVFMVGAGWAFFTVHANPAKFIRFARSDDESSDDARDDATDFGAVEGGIACVHVDAFSVSGAQDHG